MSLLADALQPYLVPGLAMVQGRPGSMSLPDLIGRQETIGFDLDFDDAEKVIVADFRESTVVLKTIASDSSRFASGLFNALN